MPPTSAAAPHLRSASMDGPWAWLAAGWRDFRRAGVYSLAYGVVFVLIGLTITAGLWRLGLSAWIPVAAGGFALVGPLLAVGLYDISRRLERGERVSWDLVGRTRVPASGQLAMLGLALCLLLLVWARAAQLIFAVFVQGEYPTLATFTGYVLTTQDGLSLLALGTVTGGVLAFTAFAISAVSAPMLFDRNVDIATAVITSVSVVRRQPGVMLLWAWIVAMVLVVGFAAALVGLAVAFPVLGHASWHAYRGVVEPPASAHGSG